MTMPDSEKKLPAIWKLSHGGAMQPNVKVWLEKHQYLAIDDGYNLKDKFINDLKIGDIVSLYQKRGHVKCFALVCVVGNSLRSNDIGDVEKNLDGRILRKYKILKKPINIDDEYEGIVKGWSPNFNNTLYEISEDQQEEFEEYILKPHYGITLNELYRLRDKIMQEVQQDLENESPVQKEDSKAIKSDAPLNQIFYGPPGTGKTYKTISEAVRICKPDIFEKYKNDRTELKKQYDELVQKGQVSFVTFHQSYGYEEFIEGLKATTEDGNISYQVADGIFKQICLDAKESRNLPYVLIIDEINRGNISKIFGELITLIEDSKREGNPEVLSLKLPYSGEVFSVPNNVYLIGTMNTADRSLALIDTALRRRFEFVEMTPDASLLKDKNIEGVELKSLLEMMNERIELLYDREHMLGHSFLLGVKTIEDLKKAFQNKILPLLQEYFFEDWEKINLVLGKNGFIEEKSVERSRLFESTNQNFPETIYKLVGKDDPVWKKLDSYTKVYASRKNDK
ncbi:AAA family ATPase [Acetobacteraceae bacterium]|nr:AAA family ATPase [Acetobacteraceae bacterium]